MAVADTELIRLGDATATTQVGTDSLAILGAIDTPIVVVRREFVIAYFNPAAEALGLTPANVGGSPRRIATLDGLAHLEDWCAAVVATGTPSRHDLRTDDRSFAIRIAPYWAGGQEIAGTVLTFVNVTALRAGIQQAIYEREYTKAILNAVADPLVVLNANFLVQTGNRAFFTFFNLSRDAARNLPLSALASGAFERPELRQQLEAIAINGGFQPLEITSDFLGQGLRTLVLNARPFSMPGSSSAMLLLSFHDISARKAAEEERHRFVSLALNSTEFMAMYDLELTPLFINGAALRLVGLDTEDEGKRTGVKDFFFSEDQAFITDRFYPQVARDGHAEVEIRFRHFRTGEALWSLYNVFALTGRDGRPTGFGVVSRDITERKHHEERQQLLLNELNHRVKNTLATVQAVAMQTLREKRDIRQAREHFEARLFALSKAHDVLTQTSWEGASLRQIVEQAVAPHCRAGWDSFEIDGPDVWLSSKQALALAMALHELCTNATKYGSLSNDTGRVRIEWTSDPEGEAGLRLRWVERDGPDVVPPAHQGFGMRMIRYGLGPDLGGDVRIDFLPSGVICAIGIPLEPKSSEATLKVGRDSRWSGVEAVQ